MQPHMEVSEHSPALGIRQMVIQNPPAYASRMPQVDRITSMEHRISVLEDQLAAQGFLIEALERRTWWSMLKDSLRGLWRVV